MLPAMWRMGLKGAKVQASEPVGELRESGEDEMVRVGRLLVKAVWAGSGGTVGGFRLKRYYRGKIRRAC